MGIEVEATATVFAKHIPAEAFATWDHVPSNEVEVEVKVLLDYVPYVEEEGGAWDEVLASGGHCENIWLTEGSFEDEGYCLLGLLTAKEIQALCDFAQNELSANRDF